ncbi:formylglycine-generating enzyme family protein [Mesorhizobium sp. M4B.F.Ca.ET.214.01.1.1]|nr:formylglycine-generating enzyme family protein [Mesorhizobium sp. M4B.F.Ca.ET.214.01.1.1]TGQ60593.1 formylglycine-generating enzyme family protein [Mesorhizobium sp. M4B.F.Ca.ET.211.01.1.1]TGU36461.1 formylglycine-generating enzyme family protein [Mesorhizobium sp. M4B.F.Ca.ET.150.01.1.1]TIX17037.1 MAG: formylglycine-generating enzyme family protein [Mesorhizobium sp.]
MHDIEQVQIPAQVFSMGDSCGDGLDADGELPCHSVSLDAFELDATAVTNEQFALFVADTDYRTDAERFGSSFVFYMAFKGHQRSMRGRVAQAPWWLEVDGACWRCPHGPESDLSGLGDHPVVHVSWSDAVAYCDWARRSLPTEAQWEAACRGGLPDKRFPWGDAEEFEDRLPAMNIWQGQFPKNNTLEDGFLTTAPVRSYQPNGYGLWQMIGNVWEWCSDWWDAAYYQQSPRENPIGPKSGQYRAMRGGSYLCNNSYCNRYRNSARSKNTPESASANIGFRTVAI